LLPALQRAAQALSAIEADTQPETGPQRGADAA
jgi:hypothetical protein